MATEFMECMKVCDPILLIGAQKGKALGYAIGLGLPDGSLPVREFAILAGPEVFSGENGKKHVSGPIRSSGISPVSLPPFEVVQLILIEVDQSVSTNEGSPASGFCDFSGMLESQPVRTEPEILPKGHGRGIPASGLDFPTKHALSLA